MVIMSPISILILFPERSPLAKLVNPPKLSKVNVESCLTPSQYVLRSEFIITFFLFLTHRTVLRKGRGFENPRLKIECGLTGTC